MECRPNDNVDIVASYRILLRLSSHGLISRSAAATPHQLPLQTLKFKGKHDHWSEMNSMRNLLLSFDALTEQGEHDIHNM